MNVRRRLAAFAATGAAILAIALAQPAIGQGGTSALKGHNTNAPVGGVTLNSPSETARSQRAIYDLDRKLVTMLGDVTLTRGASNVNGGRLVIDLDTGRAVMTGGTAGAPGTSSNGRVTGRFTVPQRNESNPPRGD